MERKSYNFVRLGSARYFFISKGKQQIAKVVKFAPIGITNIINLSFGDLLGDDSIDNSSKPNNGDIIQVLATEEARLPPFPKAILGFMKM